MSKPALDSSVSQGLDLLFFADVRLHEVNIPARRLEVVADPFQRVFIPRSQHHLGTSGSRCLGSGKPDPELAPVMTITCLSIGFKS